MKIRTISLALGIAALGLAAGCSSASSASHTATAAATTAVAAPSETTDPSGQTCPSLDSLGYCPGDDPTPTPTLTCSTTVGQDDHGNNVSAEQAIGYLVAMDLADGITDITTGNPSTQDMTVLAFVYENLVSTAQGDSGKLASDAQAFGTNLENFTGGSLSIEAQNWAGAGQTAYSKAVLDSINTLMKDCPGSAKDALNE